MHATDDQRREVAARLRGLDGDASAMNLLDGLGIVEIVGAAAIGVEVCRAVRDFDGLKDLDGMRAMLADLVEPKEQRACEMQPSEGGIGLKLWGCSLCGADAVSQLKPRFCPNCGAKVVEEGDAE